MLSAEVTILFLLSVLECLRIKSRLKWYIDIRHSQFHLSLFLSFLVCLTISVYVPDTWLGLGAKLLRRLCLCSWALILMAWVEELTGCFGTREALIEVCSEFPGHVHHNFTTWLFLFPWLSLDWQQCLPSILLTAPVPAQCLQHRRPGEICWVSEIKHMT